MRIDTSLVFLLLSLLAEILGTVGGFGSSVYFVPIANFYFSFETVLGLTALFHVASNFSKIALFRQGLNKDLLIYLGVPAVLFVIIGGVVSKYLDGHLLEIALGIFLVVLSAVFLIFKNLKISKGRFQSIVGGGLSGFLAGVLGTGGAVRGLTMAAFNLEKSVFVATSAFIDFGVDFSRTVVYFFNGYITKEVLMYIPFLIAIGWIGTWIGKRILLRVPQDKFKRISLSLILVIGLITLVRALY